MEDKELKEKVRWALQFKKTRIVMDLCLYLTGEEYTRRKDAILAIQDYVCKKCFAVKELSDGKRVVDKFLDFKTALEKVEEK